MYKDIKDKKNVDIVTPPQMSKDNDYALMVVIPKMDLMQKVQMT